jgi:osmotically inducible protein OsmC
VERQASAVWNGTLKEGSGTMTAPSGVLKDATYTWAQRFAAIWNESRGTGCGTRRLFLMAFAGKLTAAGLSRSGSLTARDLEKTDAV